jgi:hypothetical protein
MPEELLMIERQLERFGIRPSRLLLSVSPKRVSGVSET